MCIRARYPSRVVVTLLAAYHPASRRQHDLAWRHFPVLLCCLGTFHAQYMLFLLPFLRVHSHYCLLYKFSKLLGQESRFSWLAIVSLRLRYDIIYRRHFRQSVVKTPLHPFYLHLILYYLYIRLFYTHSLYTLFTLCFNHYYHFGVYLTTPSMC